MNKIDFTGERTAVPRGQRRIIDLTDRDMRQFYDVFTKSFAAAVNFSPREGMGNADNYRTNFEPLYKFIAKHAQVGFGMEFEPGLMSRVTVEDMVLPDGEFTVSFKYYSALKYKSYKIKFRGPMAPITTTWPQLIIKQGGPEVLLEKFQHV